MDKNRKIFIDGGVHFGESVTAFLENYKTYDPLTFEIYSFEAHPTLAKDTMDSFNKVINVQPNLDLYLCEAALSTHGNGQTFYIGDSHYGSTTRVDKTTGGIREDKNISVDTVDIDDFIITKFNLDDYIILKLDIEGGEYDVLPHMIRNGSIKYINELFIEWHSGKLSQCTQEEHDALVETLKTDYSLEGRHWSAKYCDI